MELVLANTQPFFINSRVHTEKPKLEQIGLPSKVALLSSRGYQVDPEDLRIQQDTESPRPTVIKWEGKVKRAVLKKCKANLPKCNAEMLKWKTRATWSRNFNERKGN